LVATKLVPVMSTAHLVVWQLIGITHQAHTLGTARTYPKSEGSSMTRSNRVALCDPCGVSAIPLTNPPPEHHTIFLRASTESQATKPSRRWHAPRVTRTTDLQLDHLVPLDATSRCNHTRITHSHDQMITIKFK
jgi:5-methylcytosine-specific restriction endonuclease McrA